MSQDAMSLNDLIVGEDIKSFYLINGLGLSLNEILFIYSFEGYQFNLQHKLSTVHVKVSD